MILQYPGDIDTRVTYSDSADFFYHRKRLKKRYENGS